MNKKQAWLELCIKHNPKLYGNDAKIALNYYCLGKGIISTLQEDKASYALDNNCDCCDKPLARIEDVDTGTGYWATNRWTKYHKDCKHIKKQHEIAQQMIDQNCNHCKHFKRSCKKSGSKIGGFDFYGHCDKLNKEVTGQSIPYCTGLEHDNCFKHRIEE